MKKSSKKICGMSWLRMTIVVVQILGLVASQSKNVDPNDQKQLNNDVEVSTRQNRAINADATSEECPHCNSIEVSKT